jgi:glycosyltransferase involved in cell wall biosynthesis
MPGPALAAHVQHSANLEGIVYSNVPEPRDDPKNSQMLDFRAGSDDIGLLHGFWPADEWGSWCSVLTPWILLPRPVSGRVAVEIALTGFDRNAHSPLTLYLGAAHCKILVPGKLIDTIHVELDLAEPAQVLGFIGVTLSPTGGEEDSRIVGIGVQSLSIRELDEPAMPSPELAPAHVRHSAHLQGIVYTSVLNPCDDRKNWQLLVRAFVHAFADCADATLVLKMTHHSQSSYLFDCHYLLQRMPPFLCNIVLMHGFLEETEYARLIARTDFYVNVSKAEGLCIPLMEFMSCGKPVIAPRHTSLCDYLDDANSIRIEASTEPCIWPHDDRGVLRTLQYRVNEESLVQALHRGRQMLLQDPGGAYRAMGLAGIETMRAYCGFDSVLGRVREFLDGCSPDADAVRNAGGFPVYRESCG